MNTKPELFTPCFPDFWVKNDSVEVEVESDIVRFTLQYGCVEIDCEAQADGVADSVYMEQQFKPEHGRDMDYTKLQVDQNTEINVIRHDVNLIEGQKLKLTKSQDQELNQQLEWICVEKVEFKKE